MTWTEGGIWPYHQFWPLGQFSRSNRGKTLFLNEHPYLWLRIWKEREISRQKWPVEKWFLWPWKGKKLRSNVMMVKMMYSWTLHRLLWSILNVCLPRKPIYNSEKGHLVVSQTFYLNFLPFQGHKNHFSTCHFWHEISRSFQIRSHKQGFSFKKRVLPPFDLENWPQGQNWWYSQMFPSLLVNLCPNHLFVDKVF